MRAPNRLGIFSDVREILDAALVSNGGEYTLETHGKAVNWRHRAYQFRKLYAETKAVKSESKYDRLIMPKIPDDSCTVVIKVRKLEGTFTPNATPVPEAPTEEEEELLDFAKGFASKLKGFDDE